MATQIISQAIIRHPDDPSVQLSIVKAEIDKQSAERNAQQEALIQMLRKDITANTAYMKQVRTSRNRFLAAELKKYRKRDWRATFADMGHAITGPLLVGWALFWLAGEKIGLWILNTGHTDKKMPTLTPRGYRVYFAITLPLNAWLWYIAVNRLIAYIHYLNG